MTFDDLLDGIDPNAGWHLLYDGLIRDGEGLCPVCHVAKRKGHGHIPNLLYYDAAEKMGGFEGVTVGHITKAADGQTKSKTRGVRAIRKLRKDLLIATRIITRQTIHLTEGV